MEIEKLQIVIRRLEQLWTSLNQSKRVRDKRSRGKSIHEAKVAIESYASSLTNEILGYLDDKVAPNALSYKWCENDLPKCIKALKEWSESMLMESKI